MAIPSPEKFGVADPAQQAWLKRRLTPHSLKAYTEPLRLQHPLGNSLPKAYIAVPDPWYPPLATLRDWVRAQPDWRWREIAVGHDTLLTAPDALADLLLAIANA